MPDILSVLMRRWKLMLLLTVIATVVSLIASLLSPKQYLGVTTAVPANSALGDKARIFNQNIEALYPELGTPDELDKIEGTAALDTIYLAAANNFHLAAHYGLNTAAPNAIENAANILRKNASIKRTGFGELKVKVWDKDNQMAATLANALLQTLNDIHQQLQTENNRIVLQKLKEEYAQKQQAFSGTTNKNVDDTAAASAQTIANQSLGKTLLASQLQQYSQLINEYELALKTTPKVLLVVESARPKPRPDKPDVPKTLVFAFLASLLFSFLLSLYLESRNQKL
jgi:capsular polysaccharide biosynthesis protein